MSQLSTCHRVHVAVVVLALALPGVVLAQSTSSYPPPAPAPGSASTWSTQDPAQGAQPGDPNAAPPAPSYPAPKAYPLPKEEYQVPDDPAAAQQQPAQGDPAQAPPPSYPPPSQAYPPADEPSRPGDAPTVPPEPDSLRTEPQAPLTPDGVPSRSDRLSPRATASSVPPGEDTGVLLDGRPRQGPFLSGPGSMTFLLHHTLLGAAGGFFTQAFANDFSFDRSSREAMLAGTLIGAGLGFGASAWWQFNNWVDRPMANFGIANSFVGGMFMAGFMDLFTQDAGVLTWSAFLGAELGAWLTAGLGGGQLPLNDGLLIASGAGWGAAYGALLLAIIHFSGSSVSGKTWRDALLLAPGIGAGALALATMRYNPTPSQILRADMFGAGVGAAVLLLSGLVLGGFNQSTPYVLSFLGSAGAITTVSLLWEESVDRSAMKMQNGRMVKDRPYKNVWW